MGCKRGRENGLSHSWWKILAFILGVKRFRLAERRKFAVPMFP